jgi:hypothetical protein
MKKNNFRNLFAMAGLLLFLGVSSTTVFGQTNANGPSFDETMRYIQNKINEYGQNVYIADSKKFYRLTYNGCNVTIIETDHKDLRVSSTSEFNLKDMEPDFRSLSFHSLHAKKVIRRTMVLVTLT